MRNSKITWTHHTFNPWWGCVEVSPGCANCYARLMSHRFARAKWGADTTRVIASEKNWRDPIRWDREAKRSGTRARVFCASMADVFEGRSDLDNHRARLWRLIETTPSLDWLLLTKRPENVTAMVPWGARWPSNAWIGCTAEDQDRADERLPIIGAIPARVRFASCEPLIGPVDLTHHLASVDWVIAGGESGPRARPMRIGWARTIRDQVTAAGTPFHFKQWGEFDEHGRRVGKAAAGRLLDGVLWDEWPAT